MSDTYICGKCDNFGICKFSNDMLIMSSKLDEIITDIPKIGDTKLAKIYMVCNKYTSNSMVIKR